jgi:hypothetical protein
MSTKETIAQRLGSFVCGMEYAKLPGEVVHRLKDLLLINWVANSLAPP